MNQLHCSWGHNTHNVYVDGVGWWVGGLEASSTSSVGCSYDMMSELLTLEGDWIPGPSSPFTDTYPGGVCAVQMNSTHTMLTGGGLGAYLNSTWIYDWRTFSWTESSSLLEGRASHGCALMGSEVLVAAGFGGNFSDILYSVEKYNPISELWTLDSTFPEPSDYRSYFTTLLSWGDEVYALEHYSSSVWKREEPGCWHQLDWIDLGSMFDSNYDSAILVPSGFVTDCG